MCLTWLPLPSEPLCLALLLKQPAPPGSINNYQPASHLPFKLGVSESIKLLSTVEHMLSCWRARSKLSSNHCISLTFLFVYSPKYCTRASTPSLPLSSVFTDVLSLFTHFIFPGLCLSSPSLGVVPSRCFGQGSSLPWTSSLLLVRLSLSVSFPLDMWILSDLSSCMFVSVNGSGPICWQLVQGALCSLFTHIICVCVIVCTVNQLVFYCEHNTYCTSSSNWGFHDWECHNAVHVVNPLRWMSDLW